MGFNRMVESLHFNNNSSACTVVKFQVTKVPCGIFKSPVFSTFSTALCIYAGNCKVKFICSITGFNTTPNR